MIRNSTQKWEVGQTVRVGFLSLVVRAKVATPGDGMPDAYLLTNAAGDRLYCFQPHCGCRAIDVNEARELMDTAQRHAARAATQALARAQLASPVDAIFASA
jgi:hypothetical protein